MEGYNGTVFAYGMTGTGKTYSMQGTHQHPGVTPSAITDIFSFIRETPQREFLLRVSYLEIYNEKIHDLLALVDGLQSNDEIKLREDQKGNVYATPLKEEIVQSPTQLLRVIARGDQARRTSSTQWNARSSRSHAIVQVVVESRQRKANPTTALDGKKGAVVPVGTRISTLSLIDLAGSERAAETKERREEGSHINRSLLTLGTVISKLSGTRDKNGQPTDKQGKHLPYRDSKLTRLLQPALAGNSLISILCTIQLGSAGSSAAAGSHVVETLNTLKFAARARNNIVSHAKRSEDHANINDAGSRALLDRYAEEIRDLRTQLDSKNTESAKLQVEDDRVKTEEEEEVRHEERVTEIHLAQLALGDRIRHLNALILSSKSTGVNQMRSQSSLSLLQQRMSTLSNATDTRSIRSSASNQTLDAGNQQRHSTESGPGQAPMSPNAEEEEDDVNAHGDATKDSQIKALQADLSDKNRYIESLENRLRQARRSSKSRVSMLFQGRLLPTAEQGGVEVLLKEKDGEISELREQLDDKERALNALRSATRFRETADMTPTTTATPPPPPQRSMSSQSLNHSNTSSQTSAGAEQKDASSTRDSKSTRRTSVASNATDIGSGNPYRSSLLASRRSSAGPAALNTRNKTTSPTTTPPAPTSSTDPPSTAVNGPRSPPLRSPRKRNHGVDDMTRMLDDMIRQKVEEQDAAREKDGGDGSSPATNGVNGGRSNSLNLLAMRNLPSQSSKPPKRDSRMSAGPEGLGINPRLSGWERENPSSFAGNVIANGRRRTSLLSQSQTQSQHRSQSSSKETATLPSPPESGVLPNVSPAQEYPSTNSTSTRTSPNRLSKRMVSSAVPLALRMKPSSSANASPVSSPAVGHHSPSNTTTHSPNTSSSANGNINVRSTTGSASVPASASASGPTFTNSTNAAMQATEALRDFPLREGSDTPTEMDTDTEGDDSFNAHTNTRNVVDTDKNGYEDVLTDVHEVADAEDGDADGEVRNGGSTVASSTVGAPTVNGDSLGSGHGVESLGESGMARFAEVGREVGRV